MKLVLFLSLLALASLACGYMATMPADIIPTSPAEPTSQTVKATNAVVNTDVLRVRESPSLSAAVVRYLTEGQVVTIYETKTVDGIMWAYIGDGWVSVAFLK